MNGTGSCSPQGKEHVSHVKRQWRDTGILSV